LITNVVIKDKQEAITIIDKGLSYVLGDLQTIELNRECLPMSFPQVLLVFSGIEFLISLIFPQKGSKTYRVSTYISNFMPCTYDRNVGDTTLGAFLYDSLRSGLAHYGNVKGDIVVDHDIAALSYHLKWVPHEGKRRLFVHGYQFAADFVESVERVKDRISKGIIPLDILQQNASRLDTLLEGSTKLQHHGDSKPDQELQDWKNGNNWIDSLPESTTGTSFTGGA